MPDTETVHEKAWDSPTTVGFTDMEPLEEIQKQDREKIPLSKSRPPEFLFLTARELTTIKLMVHPIFFLPYVSKFLILYVLLQINELLTFLHTSDFFSLG